MSKDPFEIVCDNCGEILYRGMDLKYARDILKHTGFKCKRCGAQLSVTDFVIEVVEVASL
jgi:RNase P subunit RPR2